MSGECNICTWKQLSRIISYYYDYFKEIPTYKQTIKWQAEGFKLTASWTKNVLPLGYFLSVYLFCQNMDVHYWQNHDVTSFHFINLLIWKLLKIKIRMLVLNLWARKSNVFSHLIVEVLEEEICVCGKFVHTWYINPVHVHIWMKPEKEKLDQNFTIAQSFHKSYWNCKIKKILSIFFFTFQQ